MRCLRHAGCTPQLQTMARPSAALEDTMRRIAQVIAIAVALAAFPAVADVQRESAVGPIPSSIRDTSSQTYTGRDSDEARAQREREQRKASACDTSCACGHKGAAQEHSKA